MRAGGPAARLALPGALLAAAAALAGPPAAGAAPAQVGGCALFPAFEGRAKAPAAGDLRAWNQRIGRAPEHRRSRRIMRRIRRLGGNRKLHPDFGSNPDYGIPFATVPAGQAHVPVRIGPDGFPGESDFGPAPIPSDAPIEGGPDSDGDRHVIVVERGACRLWEMYRAFPLGGPDRAWQADSTARWDLGSRALRPRGWTSADAAGLPILPGLLRYEEVAAGRVEHAVRVTFERTRRSYIPPATHFASSRCARFLPPMGLRLRLERRWFRRHRSEYPRGSQSRPILAALRRYGMVVADNGSNWFFGGASDPRWDDEDLSRLKEVPGRAFEVVRSKRRQRDGCS